MIILVQLEHATRLPATPKALNETVTFQSHDFNSIPAIFSQQF